MMNVLIKNFLQSCIFETVRIRAYERGELLDILQGSGDFTEAPDVHSMLQKLTRFLVPSLR